MKFFYFIKQLNKCLKTNFGEPEYKTLRKNVWNKFAYQCVIGLWSWIVSFIFWPIAILSRKRIQKNVIQIMKNRYTINDSLRGELYRLPIERQTRLIEVSTYIVIDDAEQIKDHYSAKMAVYYRNYKYSDPFSDYEMEIMSKLITNLSFDEIRATLKLRLSAWDYMLLGHLDMENLAKPLVAQFFKPKLEEKWPWLRAWLYFAIRNPRDLWYHLSPKTRTENLTNIKIQGFQHSLGTVAIEGIEDQELGEGFWYTEDQKYFHYKNVYFEGCYYNDDLDIYDPKQPIPKRFFQMGYGYLMPNNKESRPYLGVSIREIVNKPKYYK